MNLHPDAREQEPVRQRLILLVEDEPFVRDATCRLLRSAGFEVLSAEHACAALLLYGRCPRAIDLLMTDMVLPGRTGLQLGQELRQLCPSLAILVTSGYCNPEYEIEIPESRIFFLPKPYSRRTLVDKIALILGPIPRSHCAAQAG